jgi:hypothetical protein
MALPFIPSDAGMLALQAAVVAAPRPASQLPLLARLESRWWSLVPIGSIVVVVFAIRYVSDTATGLTYLALVAVPPLAAAALGWASRGSKPWYAIATIPLFAIAWAWNQSLAGEAAAALLSALSCVTLGVLLGAVTPRSWLKLGIVLMAAADTWLVVSNLLQAPNSVLVAAHPVASLPKLQSEIFGTVSMGYGDLFVAALLGAALASDVRKQQPDDSRADQSGEAGRRAVGQREAALLTFVIAALFDLLFFAVSELPATVPVALALIVLEVRSRVSVARRRSTRAAATPQRAT